MNNPSISGSRIDNLAQFFGRELEIYHIINRLKNMQSTAFVGDRRIGKSSLIRKEIVEQKNGGIEMAVPLFSRWLREKKFLLTTAK